LFYSSPLYSKLNAEWLDAAAVVVDFVPAVWAGSAAQVPSVDSEAPLWVGSEARQLADLEVLRLAGLEAPPLAGLEARRLVDLEALPASERSRPRREVLPGL
jgi:hypothetical protein